MQEWFIISADSCGPVGTELEPYSINPKLKPGGLGFKVLGLGFWVHGLGFRAQLNPARARNSGIMWALLRPGATVDIMSISGTNNEQHEHQGWLRPQSPLETASVASGG